MLRLFRHYCPIRNIFFVLGEGLIIYFAVLISSRLIKGAKVFAWDRLIGLKALLITAVCQASLYYNDLYVLKIADTFSEIGIRLLQALGFASIFLAGVYCFFPGTIIQKGVFVVSVGLVILFIVLAHCLQSRPQRRAAQPEADHSGVRQARPEYLR